MKPAVLNTTDLSRFVRDVPDFPRPGILFKDITPLLGDATAFRSAIAHLREQVQGRKPQLVIGIEARGFLFGSALALELGVGFAPMRKSGKLPWKTVSTRYQLEYGHDELHLHSDAIVEPNTRVLLVDDLLATGGTAAAAAKLVTQQGGDLIALAVLIELDFLRGRERLAGTEVQSVLHF